MQAADFYETTTHADFDRKIYFTRKCGIKYVCTLSVYLKKNYEVNRFYSRPRKLNIQ